MRLRQQLLLARRELRAMMRWRRRRQWLLRSKRKLTNLPPRVGCHCHHTSLLRAAHRPQPPHLLRRAAFEKRRIPPAGCA